MTAPQHYEFSYDGSSWLTDALLKTGISGGTLLNAFHYGYDAAGNRTSAQANGVATAWSANNLNQLQSQSTGNLQHVAGAVSQSATVRVNGVTATVDGSLNFAADVPLLTGSNTLTVTASGADGQLRTNRYSVNVSGTPSQSFSYDADGNMTDDGSKTYEWDAVNRLVAINYTGTSNRSEFTYNGLNQRVKIVEKSGSAVTSTKQFVWIPGEAQPSEGRDGSDNVTKRYYMPGMIVASGGNAGSYFYTRDHLGSIRELADVSGAVQSRYDYDPYGATIKISGDIDSDFGYTGNYVHWRTSLFATVSRFYSSNCGRWLTRDPEEENDSINLYLYVRNAPSNSVDPLGLGSWYFGIIQAGAPLNPSYAPNVDVAYSMDSAERKCCSQVIIHRYTHIFYYHPSEWIEDDVGSPTANTVMYARAPDDWPWGLISDYHFKYEAVCTAGPLSGKVLSTRTRSLHVPLLGGASYWTDSANVVFR